MHIIAIGVQECTYKSTSVISNPHGIASTAFREGSSANEHCGEEEDPGDGKHIISIITVYL